MVDPVLPRFHRSARPMRASPRSCGGNRPPGAKSCSTQTPLLRLARITARWEMLLSPGTWISARMSGARFTRNSDSHDFLAHVLLIVLPVRSTASHCQAFPPPLRASARNSCRLASRPDSKWLRTSRSFAIKPSMALVTGARLRLKISVHKSGEPRGQPRHIPPAWPGTIQRIEPVHRRRKLTNAAASTCGKWLSTATVSSCACG